MGLRVLGVGVVQVVGGHERQLQVLGELEQVAGDPLLDPQAVVHELAVVVLGAEDVAELRRGLPRLLVLAQAQAGLHLAGGAAGGGDEALAVGVQQLAVHARLVQLALQGRQGRGAEQVLHALGGLREQRHVRVGAAARDVVPAAVGELHAGAVGAGGARRQVGLHADDGLDPRVAGLVPEVEGPEDEAVVGRRQGGHPQFVAGLEEVVEACRTVEHRVLGVHVEVGEAVLAGRRRHPTSVVVRTDRSAPPGPSRGGRLPRPGPLRRVRRDRRRAASRGRRRGPAGTGSRTRRAPPCRGARSPGAWRAATAG